MLSRAALLCCLLCLSGLTQAEVYKWVDAEGKTHFGDRKPAATKAETLNLPTTPAPAADAPAPAATEDYRARQKKLLDALSEERANRQQAAQKQAERQAKLKKNCAELRDYQRSIATGRTYRLNDRGERVYDDDAAHAREVQRVDDELRRYCQ